MQTKVQNEREGRSIWFVKKSEGKSNKKKNIHPIKIDIKLVLERKREKVCKNVRISGSKIFGGGHYSQSNRMINFVLLKVLTDC